MRSDSEQSELDLLKEENLQLKLRLSEYRSASDEPETNERATENRPEIDSKAAFESSAGGLQQMQSTHNHELFSRILNIIPMGLYMVDEEFRLIHVNAASYQVFADIHPLIGRNFAEIMRILWPEERAAEIISIFEHTLSTGQSYISPPFKETRQDSGAFESYEWQLHRIPHVSEKRVVVCYFSDVTERERAESNVQFSISIDRILATSYDELETIQEISALMGGHFSASHVYLSAVDEDEKFIAVQHEWREDENVMSIIGSYRLADFMSQGQIEDAKSGNPQVVENVINSVASDNSLETLGKMQVRSYINAPYVSDGRWKFSLSVTRAKASVWRPDEIQLMRDLSLRVWSSIERSRATKQLSQSEEYFRQLAETLPQMVWVSDEHGKLTYINQKWHDFSGLSLSETNDPVIAGEIYHPEDRKNVAAAWVSSLETTNPFEIEARMKSRTGDYHWFLIRAEVFNDSNGRFSNWFGTSTDITQHKAAAERLRLSEERFRLAENASSSFVYDWNVRTGKEERSDGFTKILGYLNSDFPNGGEHWEALIHPEDVPMVRKASHEALENDVPVTRVEYRALHRSGEWIWVSDEFAVVRDRSGEVERVIGLDRRYLRGETRRERDQRPELPTSALRL